MENVLTNTSWRNNPEMCSHFSEFGEHFEFCSEDEIKVGL